MLLRLHCAGFQKAARSPVLIALVGGSGSGKTWLADRLQKALAPDMARLSLDDFYLDRAHLALSRRAHLNFDHPRSIDWLQLEEALKRLMSGRPARIPQYDFKTHCRLPGWGIIKPKPIVLIEGLWLLRRPTIRRFISLGVFLHCSSAMRLKSRLARDQAMRGRSRRSIQEQFQASVQPMHALYVEPQSTLAHVIIRRRCGPRQVRRLVDMIRLQLGRSLL
jgi:uridine kinase